MKPPICAICDKKFAPGEGGGIIYFKKTDQDIAWEKKVEAKGMVGHPPYAEWFCAEHYAAAKELEYLTIAEAMARLREKFKR